MGTNYKLRNVDWNEIRILSKNILSQIKTENLEIDTLVTIFRGGSVLSLILSANIENLKTACIHVTRSLSNDANAEFGSSIYKGITNFSEIEGKNILLTEDIIDSGLTIDNVIQELKKYNPKNIYIATFYNFNKGKYKNVISGERMSDYCWIVFPWEEKLNERD